jgi:sugar lactone lactonase YvrE
MTELAALPVCLALAACSGQQHGDGNIEVKDVEIAAVFSAPAGVGCIRITASNAKRTSSADFGVTAGTATASFAMHGVPTGDVVFTGAAYSDQCAFAFLTPPTPPSWVADPVTVAVTPGPASTSVTLRFRGSGNVTVGVDFGDSTSYSVSTIAGNGTQGSADGFGAAARFEGPNGIALDGDNLYIVDRNLDNTGAVFPFLGMTIRRLTRSTGQVTTLAGDPNAIGTNDGPGSTARFSRLRGIAVSGAFLYVADGCALRKISTAPPFTVTTLIGTPRPPPNQANWLCGRPFVSLLDLAVRPSGVYVLDNGRFAVSRIDLSASPPTINLVAGVPDVSGSDDGTISALSPGHFLFPNGLVFPFAGNDDVFYVGDSGNIADSFYGFIRRVSILEDSITTVAGALHADFLLKDGLGTAALFNSTRRIASDGNNLFVGDQPAIRRLDLATFAVTTIAGGNTFGYLDGPGSSAQLSLPNGIATAPGGKIYFADQGNFVIRVLTP